MVALDSRSGKTFISIYALIVRAAKVKSRHLIVRLKFNHVKTAIWMDTLPTVLEVCFPNLNYHLNKTDYFLTLDNGSELWVAGLDDKQRTEKILGKEYSTIFFNECSQIPLDSINIAMTRLAQKNTLAKKLYYDENPPSKKHWSYWLFVRGVHPMSEEKIDSSKYASILMNPKDNLQNIDQEYIQETLALLPPKERARFELGEFTEVDEGSIYYTFDRDRHVKQFDKPQYTQWYVGMDFNIKPMTAVICFIEGDTLFVWDEVYLEKIVNSRKPQTESACLEIQKKVGKKVTVVPDSTGKRITSNTSKSDIQIIKDCGFQVNYGNNPFRVDRYAAVNSAFSLDKVVIHPRCKYTIKDLENVFYKEGSDQPDTTDPMATHISDGLGYLIHKTINPLKGKSIKVTSFKR